MREEFCLAVAQNRKYEREIKRLKAELEHASLQGMREREDCYPIFPLNIIQCI